jgi:hypothetical protein
MEPRPPLTGETVWERIEQAMRAAELNMHTLAHAIHVAYSTVHAWKTGKSEPRFAQLRSVARVTGYGVTDLVPPGEIVDRSQSVMYPALREFLASSLAADVTAEERAALESYVAQHGEPTVKTFDRLLEAHRSVRRFASGPDAEERVVRKTRSRSQPTEASEPTTLVRKKTGETRRGATRKR